MVAWHHRFTGHELGQTLGDGEGQRSLACCSSRGHKELDMIWQLNNNTQAWSELKSVWPWSLCWLNFLKLCLSSLTGVIKLCSYKTTQKEFPGGLVVSILGFYCRGLQFNIWSGNWDPASHMVRKKTKINKQDHTDIHTCPRKHISEGARIQPIFCCSPFSCFSFFLLCSLRKTISLLGLIIIRHRVESWPSKGGYLRSRFNPGLTSWAWWWVQVLWEADPEALKHKCLCGTCRAEWWESTEVTQERGGVLLNQGRVEVIPWEKPSTKYMPRIWSPEVRGTEVFIHQLSVTSWGLLLGMCPWSFSARSVPGKNNLPQF